MNVATTKLFCIQCRDLTSDKTGSFIYERQAPFRAISPVFEDCEGLFRYMRDRGMTTGALTDFIVYEENYENS